MVAIAGDVQLPAARSASGDGMQLWDDANSVVRLAVDQDRLFVPDLWEAEGRVMGARVPTYMGRRPKYINYWPVCINNEPVMLIM